MGLGVKPPEVDDVFVFETLFFDASDSVFTKK